MRRTLWWVERIALLVFAAILLPGATSAALNWTPSPEGTHAEPARASAATPDTTLPPAPDVPALTVPLEVRPAPAATPAASSGHDPQVIALYGYPGIAFMGVLGNYDPDTAAAQAARLAVEWDAANGPDRAAVGALHLIVSVAQPYPMADGSYLARMDPDLIRTYVEATRRGGVRLILDTQIGLADPLAEARWLEPFLCEPHVHLALDPEFAMHHKGGVPGENIGSLHSADVNRVAKYLGTLVRAHHLPTKQLVLHQFRADMLLATEGYTDVEGVHRIVDMDGWGAPGVKLDGYTAYALAPYAQRPAIKLFWEWDSPLITVEELLALPRIPDLVIYQ